jgi:hypothetical protein
MAKNGEKSWFKFFVFSKIWITKHVYGVPPKTNKDFHNLVIEIFPNVPLEISTIIVEHNKNYSDNEWYESKTRVLLPNNDKPFNPLDTFFVSIKKQTSLKPSSEPFVVSAKS